ncbi:hypothetical protein ACWDWU_11460 [Streptomyces sp. NPDC003442]
MDSPSALLAKDQWRQPAGASALQRSLDWHRDPARLHHVAAFADLNVLAFALVAAQRANEANDVFATLRGVVTPWPWNALGDPLMAYERASRRAPR